MRTRFHASISALLLAAILAAASGLARADEIQATPPDPTPKPPGEQHEWITPPKELPNVRGADRLRNLDFLFGALKAAPDEASAKVIENRIWALWLVSRSDTANLLMTRVKTAVDGKDNELALKLLDAIVKVRPDYVEAWNRRATLHYSSKNYGAALADIREVLKREPRHFGALSGLGLILNDIGEEAQALEAFRRALAVHPRLERIPDLVQRLSEKVEGRDI